MIEVKEAKRAKVGFVMSLIGGIIDTIVAIIFISFGSFLVEVKSFFAISQIVGFAMTTLGAVRLVFAILVIIGAVISICLATKSSAVYSCWSSRLSASSSQLAVYS